jgi:GntR family transcriptional regulator, transcriptional repressor for pyruvate dehydrogenase complex
MPVKGSARVQLAPVERSSAADEVYDQLVASILDGEVAVGHAIPSERALSDALGVSRPVVREALQRLAHAGLVSIRHGGATTVTDFRRTAGPDLLGVLLLDRNGDLNVDVARSIIEARVDLGPPVVAAAARHVTDADVADLRTLLDDLAATDNLRERQRIALDFWDRVVDASGNVVHRLLFNALRRAYEPVMDALAVLMQSEFADVDGYAAVVAALEARDPDRAANAVRDLVGPGATAMLSVIDGLLALPADPDDAADLDTIIDDPCEDTP